jgi:nitrogen regulatory protein P-II 1
MKYIIAMIQPDRIEEVQACLFKRDINLMTVTQVVGCGRQKGIPRVYRGRVESGNLLKKLKLEIAVNDEFVQSAIDAIKEGAYTGNIGDGKIFVMDLEQAFRIRTGEVGSEAIG